MRSIAAAIVVIPSSNQTFAAGLNAGRADRVAAELVYVDEQQDRSRRSRLRRPKSADVGGLYVAPPDKATVIWFDEKPPSA
jgi:hypothetical protein